MRWPGAYAAFVLPKVGITDRKYTSEKLWTTTILSGKKFNSRQAKWAHTSVHNPDTPITQIFPTVLQFLLSWHKDPSTRSPQPIADSRPQSQCERKISSCIPILLQIISILIHPSATSNMFLFTATMLHQNYSLAFSSQCLHSVRAPEVLHPLC